MADETTNSEDKTEEATQERRDEFRDQGQVAFSRELTSVSVLAAATLYLVQWFPKAFYNLEKLFIDSFQNMEIRKTESTTILQYAISIWRDFLLIIVPLFLLVAVVSIFITLGQTRLNWSWKKVSPDFSRLNPFSGIKRMFEFGVAVELMKSIAKLTCILLISLFILKGEWAKIPTLLNWPILSSWNYWGTITKDLFWGIIGLLLLIATADYLYQFISFERNIKMTKQELKEDYKRRELDPNVKGRMRRMQRDAIMRNTMAKTKKATALITNPTHFSIAIKYDYEDAAPIVIAKGEDEIALRMREIAKDSKIPIIENRPLARALYAQVNEGELIPRKFYAAVAEVIKYVFKLKGRRIPSQKSKSMPPLV